jgi:hypothetical protein
MGFMKINSDQYLGKQEYNRLLYFIKDEGWLKFIKALTQQTGVCFVANNSLEVTPGSLGAFSIQPGFAVDKDYNVMQVPKLLNPGITVPSDNVWYYVYIKYVARTAEAGIVNVGADGSITATQSPHFTDVLRGQPSNPVIIRFPESVVNVDDYEVLSVESDSEALLNVSSMTAETGAKFSVVGSFTPGIAINEDSKLIYTYDDFEIGIALAVLDTAERIPLARVKYNGTALDVEDLRSQYKYKLINQI